MTAPGPPEPEETLPPTHRPFGEGREEPQEPGWGVPSSSASSPQAPGPSPYGHPGYGAALYQPQQAHGGATAAMVLGIICVVGAVLTPFCGVTIVGIITGPFAIVLGITSMREIGRNPGVYTNHGQAIAGLVTGVVGSLIGLLMLALVVLFFGMLGVFVGV